MSDWESEFGGESLLAQDAWEARQARANFRTEVWTTKDGREIAIRDMEDNHLFNAYKLSQDGLLFREMGLLFREMGLLFREMGLLFREMVLRLFEDKLRSAK